MSGLDCKSSGVMSGVTSTIINNGAVPRDVGALSSGKGKEDKGEGCKRNATQAKAKVNTTKATAKVFQRHCSTCGVWGHNSRVHGPQLKQSWCSESPPGAQPVRLALPTPSSASSPYGQVVAELHVDDLHASGPLDMLREIQKLVEFCVAIKHSTIFPAGKKT